MGSAQIVSQSVPANMFSIVSRFTTSLMGLIGESASSAEVEIRVEEIRSEMLAIMSELPDQPSARSAPWTRVWAKVSRAANIQTLWYLRIDLMALLSAHCGENVARDKLAAITKMFRGVLPPGQMAKPDRFRQ